jgi:hypothetical protein
MHPKPCPLAFIRKTTLILLREPPFSYPHNVASNPRDIILPSYSVSLGKLFSPHWEVLSTPPRKPTFPKNSTLFLAKRLFLLPEENHLWGTCLLLARKLILFLEEDTPRPNAQDLLEGN